jgi:hypothetical protein
MSFDQEGLSMLLIEANISFYIPDDNKKGYNYELDAKAIIRRDINLGGYLTAGQIFPSKEEDILYRGQTYPVMIEMPLIFAEAYGDVKDVLKAGSIFTIQEGSRIVGEGQILGFHYENDEDRWRK